MDVDVYVAWMFVSYQDLYAFLFHRTLVICSSTHSHQGVNAICLKILHIKKNMFEVHQCLFLSQ